MNIQVDRLFYKEFYAHPKIEKMKTFQIPHFSSLAKDYSCQRPGFIFVYFEGPEPRGLAYASMNEDCHTWQTAFYVEPGFRRQGVATAIAKHVLSFYDDIGAVPQAKHWGTAGAAFYTRLGFKHAPYVPAGHFRQSTSKVFEKQIPLLDAIFEERQV